MNSRSKVYMAKKFNHSSYHIVEQEHDYSPSMGRDPNTAFQASINKKREEEFKNGRKKQKRHQIMVFQQEESQSDHELSDL
jgi:hypothetical protein